MIRLGHVSLNEKAKDLVNLVLEKGSIGQSEMVSQFEEAFAKWLGVKHCIATASGTIADTVALAVLKYFNPTKDEVIVPALTFVAQINAVHYNHLKPVFCDVLSAPYFYLDPAYSTNKINKKTLCIFPAHLLGVPAPIEATGNYLGVPIVGDACEALGSTHLLHDAHYKVGSFGAMTTFSFFPSHTITTGEGGMIATNDSDYAEVARRLITHGKISNNDFHFDVIGFNGKMSSLQAAVGLGMMDELDSIVSQRRMNLMKLGGKLSTFYGSICPHAMPYMAKSREHREAILEILRVRGIECRNLFSCIPTQEPAYAHLGHRPGDFPIAEDIGNRGFYVPCHQGLSEEDIQLIKKTIEAVL